MPTHWIPSVQKGWGRQPGLACGEGGVIVNVLDSLYNDEYTCLLVQERSGLPNTRSTGLFLFYLQPILTRSEEGMLIAQPVLYISTMVEAIFLGISSSYRSTNLANEMLH